MTQHQPTKEEQGQFICAGIQDIPAGKFVTYRPQGSLWANYGITTEENIAFIPAKRIFPSAIPPLVTVHKLKKSTTKAIANIIDEKTFITGLRNNLQFYWQRQQPTMTESEALIKGTSEEILTHIIEQVKSKKTMKEKAQALNVRPFDKSYVFVVEQSPENRVMFQHVITVPKELYAQPLRAKTVKNILDDVGIEDIIDIYAIKKDVFLQSRNTISIVHELKNITSNPEYSL